MFGDGVEFKPEVGAGSTGARRLCSSTVQICPLSADNQYFLTFSRACAEDTCLMTSLINLSWFFPRWVVQPTITSSWPTPAPAALLAWLLEVWAQVQAPPEVPLQWAPCTDQEGARRGSPSTQTTALDHSRDT